MDVLKLFLDNNKLKIGSNFILDFIKAIGLACVTMPILEYLLNHPRIVIVNPDSELNIIFYFLSDEVAHYCRMNYLGKKIMECLDAILTSSKISAEVLNACDNDGVFFFLQPIF